MPSAAIFDVEDRSADASVSFRYVCWHRQTRRNRDREELRAEQKHAATRRVTAKESQQQESAYD